MTVHYSLIQFFFWFSYGATVSFASVYLLSNGATNTVCGIVSAVASALSVFIQPWVASYADREDSLSVKALVLILDGLMLSCFAVLMFLFGRGWLVNSLILGLAILGAHVLLPIVNSLATETMNAGKKLNFSLARGVGSIGYAVMSFSLGKIAAKLGAQALPGVTAAMLLVLLILTVVFPFEKRKKTDDAAGASGENAPVSAGNVPVSAGSFFGRYRIFSFALIGCSLVFASHTYINSFVYQIAVGKGGTSENMGVAMALAGVIEILPMLVFAFLLKKKSAGFWMCFSSIFFALKCLGTLLAPTIPAFYMVQLFQPLGWGLMTVASVYYVNSIMQDRDRIKGQAYMTMTLSIGTIIGTLTGGVLIDIFGVNGMLAVSVAAGVAGMAVLMATIGRDEMSRR